MATPVDPVTQRIFEDLNATIHSDGWDYLVSDLEAKIEALKEELTNPQVDNDLLKIAQGRILAYRDIVNLPKFVEKYFQDIEDSKLEVDDE